MKESICKIEPTSDEKNRTPLTLEMPVDLMQQLTEAATLADTDVQSLAICYVQQGLTNSSTDLKREQFLLHTKELLAKHGVHDTTDEEILDKFLF